jgi:phosphatidylserine/phosphatidylglycerophosphate/cardiolipin synthase-like enzyme
MAAKKAPPFDLATFAASARFARVQLLVDREHYVTLVQGALARARVSVWIGTANVKELLMEAPLGSVAHARGRYVSIVERFAELTRDGVEVRLLHAGTPSRAFRAALERKQLARARRFTMRQCPRVHLKMIAVDGAFLYLGSANLTGAGLGAKGEGRRNFELGLVTDDDVLLDATQERFEAIWRGRACKGCRLRAVCPAPLDEIGA